MSKTVIECKDAKLLDGFEAAANFFVGVDCEVTRGDGFILIERDDDWDNVTFTLNAKGLAMKHLGVEV